MSSSAWEIISIVGPTSSKKTDLSIELADILNGEIISADSRQIYKDLDIGTGKPSPQQLKRIKHYLISCTPPNEPVTAYQFSIMAEEIFKKIKNLGSQCFLVGGTGLWIKSFCDGLSPTPPPNPEFREKLKKEISQDGLLKHYLYLIDHDPGIIGRIKPNDKMRIIRSLEILKNSDLLPSEIRGNTIKIKHKTLKIGCYRPKNVLYQVAEQKIDNWLSAGWIDEVQHLLDKGIDPSYPAMQALGYSHIVKYLRNDFSKTTMIEMIKRDTRRYIKRQLTWFRADHRIHWIDTDRPFRQVVKDAQKMIKNLI
jgi:tRNA dimethylallyltransferase